MSGGSYPWGIVILFTPRSSRPDPVDTGRKLNVHKTFRRRPGRLLNALCTFNLRPVSTGEVFYKKGILKYFARFTGKQLCRNFFFNKVAGLRVVTLLKETPIKVFSCKFYEIFENSFFIKHLQWLPLGVHMFNENKKTKMEIKLKETNTKYKRKGMNHSPDEKSKILETVNPCTIFEACSTQYTHSTYPATIFLTLA